MITVDEARNIVAANCNTLNSIKMPIEDAAGYALVSDIESAINIPSFLQSSMDGYAIRMEDKNELLPIQDELPAGTSKKIFLLEHHAVKVFTGGPVPDGADMVVQKEWVTEEASGIRIVDKRLAKGDNIRHIGSEISKGKIAIPKGTIMNAMQIGYLASLGITNIQVYRKPSIALIITGNELIQPGNELKDGQVYESNSYGLRACLKNNGINLVYISFAKDNLEETEEKIKQAISNFDMVLLTGGVSVGDYDFVSKACVNQGIELLFHGVQQKPGKPLFFGKKDNKLVFGLPGNPASVLSCYQQYVLPAILKMSGCAEVKPIFAKLKQSYQKNAALRFFLKGYFENGVVSVLSAQASFQLSAFTEANCWVELDEETMSFEQFQKVRIHMLQ
ncbi:MAG: molybdopterin molybdotransferase MoeA [Chitinophagaceae bacterium]|nr:molybdopterin molybdotransferase MoeA [Chitinophagaceae bacterium]